MLLHLLLLLSLIDVFEVITSCDCVVLFFAAQYLMWNPLGSCSCWSEHKLLSLLAHNYESSYD